MGTVVSFEPERIQAFSSDDALALCDVQRLRDACRIISHRIDDLTLADGVALGRNLDRDLVALAEVLVRRLSR